MAELIFVRHAEAEQKMTTDAARRLTDKGQKQSQFLADLFAAELTEIDLFVQSEIVRSQETLQLLIGGASDLRIETTGLLYEVPPIEFIKWFKLKANRLNKVLVVGHESHMTEMIGWCIARTQDVSIDIKKAGVVRLEIDDFNNILERKMSLTELVTFKKLKAQFRPAP